MFVIHARIEEFIFYHETETMLCNTCHDFLLVKLNPHRKLMVGGGIIFKVQQPSLIRLVIWVESGPRPLLVVGSRRLGPGGSCYLSPQYQVAGKNSNIKKTIYAL